MSGPREITYTSIHGERTTETHTCMGYRVPGGRPRRSEREGGGELAYYHDATGASPATRTRSPRAPGPRLHLSRRQQPEELELEGPGWGLPGALAQAGSGASRVAARLPLRLGPGLPGHQPPQRATGATAAGYGRRRWAGRCPVVARLTQMESMLQAASTSRGTLTPHAGQYFSRPVGSPG